MNEAIEVEARFTAEGRILPKSFVWRERRYALAAIGRQWEEDGERRFLVMTADEQVYDLAYLPAEAAWRLRRTPQHFGSKRRAV